MSDLDKAQENFTKSSEELLAAILGSDKDRWEKLNLIKNHRLFPVDSYYIEPFEDRVDEWVKELEVKGETGYTDYWHRVARWMERYQTYYFVDFLEGEPEDKVTIGTFGKHKLKISLAEFEEIIFNYAIENKVIGFVFDWEYRLKSNEKIIFRCINWNGCT